MKHGRLYLYPGSNVDRDWSPFTKGTFDDLAEGGITVLEGMRLKFYDSDADEGGQPDDLLFEGSAHFIPDRGWGAIIDAKSFHWESDERKTPDSGSKVDLGGQRK